MFCSTSVSVHLLRGAAALGLFFAAIYLSSVSLILMGIAAIGAVFMLRGCPMCWLMGLFETIQQRRALKNLDAVPRLR